MSINLSQKQSKYDIIVVGGGPSGYMAAIRAAQDGASVAIVEKSNLGGTCLNKGCIPSKSYLKTAQMIEQISVYSKRGINLKNLEFDIDIEKVVAEKDSVVKKLRTGLAAILESYKITVYTGEAKVNPDKTVFTGEALLEAKKVILATGSRPKKLELPGSESKRILNSDDIFELKEIPKELIIVGAGPISLEIATIYRAFGSKVTMVSHSPKILKKLDGDISKEVERIIKRKGIKLIKSAKLESFKEKENTIQLHLEGQTLEGEYILVAIGQEPVTEAVKELNLATKNSTIKVNEFLETSLDWIYAPGDINGISMSAHAAYMMGQLAAENAVRGVKKKFDKRFVPSCIFTSPEIATIGMTEEEAANTTEIATGKFYFSANGRALAYGESHGFVKIIAGKKYGEILGAHIVGVKATELINEISIIMQNELTAYEVVNTIHAHPTYSEAIAEACADAIERRIHLLKK